MITRVRKPAAAVSKVAALERALSVLGVFEVHDGPLTLARIAEVTGLYKSTILRLLASFEEHGYVLRLADGTYVLGPTTFRLGRAYEKSLKITDLIVPALEYLVSQGTESASFHVREGEQRLCVYRVDSRHTTLDTVKAGDYLPLDRGAAGRILTAYPDDGSAKAKRIREDGIAYSQGERDPACSALAAPVFGRDGLVIGAISLSGPKERFTRESIEHMSSLLKAVARDVSARAVSINARDRLFRGG